jgi:hypothetical protein
MQGLAIVFAEAILPVRESWLANCHAELDSGRVAMASPEGGPAPAWLGPDHPKARPGRAIVADGELKPRILHAQDSHGQRKTRSGQGQTGF